MKDQSLQHLFNDYNPSLSSTADFMADLNKRLDAVEYIKQYQTAQLRRYRYVMVATLVFGIICGAIGCAIVLSLPENAIDISFNSQLLPLVIIEQNWTTVLLLFIAAITIGVMLALHNIIAPLLCVQEKSRKFA